LRPRQACWEKRVRHLHENSRAVAGILLAAAGAAMIEIFENCQRLVYDLVRLFAFDVDHEPDAAGIVFKSGIIESLLRWHS
jgi:hypothetical protein